MKGKFIFGFLLFSGVGLIDGYYVGKRWYFAHSAPAPAVAIMDRAIMAYSYDRQAVYDSLKIDSGDIVFVGNSLTEHFPVHEFFQDLRIKNRGISGNTTADILERIPKIAAANPSKIFLEAGINDLAQSCPVDSVVARWTRIIRSIRILSPHTHIYIQSLTPTRKDWEKLNPAIKEVNAKLQTIGINDLIYIDLYNPISSVSSDGLLLFDGIHFGYRGYAIWAACIKKYMN